MGAFDGKGVPAIDYGDDLLDRTSHLIAAARDAQVPVIFIQHCALEDQLLVEGTEAWELHPSIKPDRNELVVHKRESSAFHDTNLSEALQQLNLDTVITCGLQSEHCVSNTSIAALELGFKVIVAQDAHSTWSTDDDRAESIIVRQNALLEERGATVQSTGEIVARLCA